MGFDEGSIRLNSDNGVYYPGQTVYGRINFDQENIKTIHGIYVSFKGFCKVQWTSQERRRRHNDSHHHTVTHTSYEEYIKRKIFVFGDSIAENQLPVGHHEFTFEFHIPANCPSTFEGTYGHVRYRVKAVMMNSAVFSSNKEKIVSVGVVALKDLNLNPYCKEPIEYQITQTYCCWCLNAGASEVLVKLPVAGYCPGQVILIEVICKNNSSVEISEIIFAIKKDVRYIAEAAPGTRVEKEIVAVIKKGPVPGHTTRNWTVDLEVPAVNIYNMDGCRFIKVDYRFKVSTETSGCHKDGAESHPIILGHIPLVGYQDNVQNPLRDQMPAQFPQVTNYPAPIVNQPLPNTYPSPVPYPPGNAPYPGTPNVSAVPPYPDIPPTSYPATNTFRSSSPYPTNQPYPGLNPGQASINAPHPEKRSPVPPYPGSTPGLTSDNRLKTGTLGFTVTGDDSVTAPLLPPGANVPYPIRPASPYASASAPEPSTPDSEEKKPGGADSSTEITSNNPPYNPEFMNNQKRSDN